MKKRVCEICGKTKSNVVKKHKTNNLVCEQCNRQARKKIAKCVKCGKSKVIQWAGKCYACYKSERRKILNPNKIKIKPPLNKDELANYLSKNKNTQIKDVAVELSRSIDTVRKYIKRYKIAYTPPRSHNVKINDRVLLKYVRKNPKAYAEDIAKHFNVHSQTIFRHLRAYNIRMKHDKIRSGELIKYIEENPNKIQREIAAHFGLSEKTIRRRIKEANISH